MELPLIYTFNNGWTNAPQCFVCLICLFVIYHVSPSASSAIKRLVEWHWT